MGGMENVKSSMLYALLAELDQRILRMGEDASLLSQRLSLMRALGDLAGAALVAEKLLAKSPSHKVASQFFRVMNGVGLGVDETNGIVPFVRLTNVFSFDEKLALWGAALCSGASGRPATIIASKGEHVVDPHTRTAFTYNVPDASLQSFVAKVRHLIEIEDVYARLGMAYLEPTRIEVTVSRYANHGHFSIHSDVGPGTPPRKITVVYYMHRHPRTFSGGDLTLFDSTEDMRGGEFTGFTRVFPEDNSLIFFPSNRLHAVSQVQVNSDDPRDARWSVNLWLHGRKD